MYPRNEFRWRMRSGPTRLGPPMPPLRMTGWVHSRSERKLILLCCRRIRLQCRMKPSHKHVCSRRWWAVRLSMRQSELASALAEVESHYAARHPLSERRHASAARHLPGGNTRTVLHFSPFPLTFAGGKGNRLTDVDGLSYQDLLGEYSAG